MLRGTIGHGILSQTDDADSTSVLARLVNGSRLPPGRAQKKKRVLTAFPIIFEAHRQCEALVTSIVFRKLLSKLTVTDDTYKLRQRTLSSSPGKYERMSETEKTVFTRSQRRLSYQSD